MKLMESFVKSHKSGSHCGSTMMRTLLNGYGYPYSEDLCFGLGSGLGFTYHRYIDAGVYFFTGRNESLLENLAGTLGARVESGRSDDSDTGWKGVKEMMDAHIPVILDLDRMYLPYLVEKNRLAIPYHFGLHNALLVGYDEVNDDVYLLDYLWNDIQKLTWKQLAASRNSLEAPVNPENAWRTMIPPERPRSLERAVDEAIARNIHRMREPFAFKMGLPGIRMFAREIRRWRITLSPEERMRNAYMASVLLERVGTGGGNFRRMYARFLVEAAHLTRNDQLKLCSVLYFELFRKWRRIVRLFERGAKFANEGIFDPDVMIDSELNDLVELEYAAITQLASAIGV